MLQPAQHRRYGGYDLARACYFTLCVDASGDDFFTLSTELNAYRDRSGQHIIVDVMDGKHFPAEIFSNPGLSKEIQRLKDFLPCGEYLPSKPAPSRGRGFR